MQIIHRKRPERDVKLRPVVKDVNISLNMYTSVETLITTTLNIRKDIHYNLSVGGKCLLPIGRKDAYCESQV